MFTLRSRQNYIGRASRELFCELDFRLRGNDEVDYSSGPKQFK
jgi:hypothetical protein